MSARVFAVIALATVLCLPVVVADGPGRGGMRDQMMDRMDSRWSNMSAQHQREGMDRAERHGMFARFNYSASTGALTGRFVSLNFTASDASIADYTVKDGNTSRRFFDHVTIDKFSNAATPQATGSVFHARSDDARILVHNNPLASAQWQARAPVNLTFTLASGATILNSSAKEVKIGVGGAHGHVATNGNASITVQGTTIVVSLGANDSAVFRFHASNGMSSDLHDELHAFEARQLGATIHLANAGGQAVDDQDPVDVDVEPGAMRSGHLEMNVSSEQHNGRTLFLVVDGDSFDPNRTSAIVVKFQGAAAAHVANAQAAIASSQAAVSIESDPSDGTTHLVIHVPHFSTFALLVDQPFTSNGGSSSGGATSNSKGSPGFEFAFVGIAVAALVALRRRG